MNLGETTMANQRDRRQDKSPPTALLSRGALLAGVSLLSLATALQMRPARAQTMITGTTLNTVNMTAAELVVVTNSGFIST